MVLVASFVYRKGKRCEPVPTDGTLPFLGKRDFVWIGLHEPVAAEIEGLARTFGLHELAVEDALNSISSAPAGSDPVSQLAERPHSSQ
ncbi:magnesium and cobalt transport protein CorA [Pseudorhizobium endolithicum]|uniref:Magnesium and cobalt transport protein CorA n=1 Tax=Pseudorhizobium endolithicum TaxID=1191678 RepID=A0ABM8PG10_9HYPH|nr:hypothetical protein [Pseudorhizobium endolithicum]CAD7027812.1 magnesium and cobalt transport protein CorA [Pseudorhizobium endolithicum]